MSEAEMAILFVDDEAKVLSSLRRNLNRDPYDCVFAQSGQEALKILAERRIDVIVADLQMPEMDGVQLLQAVRERHPGVVRLVLSASTDVGRILDAINRGEVFRFIVKPIGDLQDLRSAVGQAAAQVLLERRARESDRLQAEFLACVTHELKSPLASIKGFANAIREDADMDAATRDEFLEFVTTECERLSQLVTSILDVSCIAAGNFPIEMEPTDLGLLIEETTDSLRPHFEKKGIWLRVETPGAVPDVEADRARLIQVFRNLLDNALKFTPEGGEVTVSLARDNGALVVRVANTGCGIDAADLPRVFERFFRGRQRGARVGGAGLGLALVKEVLGRHRWTINIDSKPDAGTTVTVRTTEWIGSDL
jgi:signal transduction histidine kinase